MFLSAQLPSENPTVTDEITIAPQNESPNNKYSKEDFTLLKNEIETLKNIAIQNQSEIQKLRDIIMEIYQAVSKKP